MTQVASYPRRGLNTLDENQKMDKDRYERRGKRRQLRLRFYCNGDRYFKSKRVCLDPKAHNSFQDLLNSISLMMPVELYLRNGVQRIYTPSNGTRVQTVEQLVDGSDYVLAGNETFKPIKYGSHVLEPWGKGQPQSSYKNRFAGRYVPPMVAADESNYVGYNAFPPSRFYRQIRSNKFPYYAPGAAVTSRKESTARYSEASGQPAGPGLQAPKPKVITVVQAGSKSPRKLIKVLLNRRSIQPFEQLMVDVGEQFVAPTLRDGANKMFTMHGREVMGISDFFREEDVFIWVSAAALSGHTYGPGLAEVRELLYDLYWDKEWKIPPLMKEWERRQRRADRQRRKQQQEIQSQNQHPPQPRRTSLVPSSQRSQPHPTSSVNSLPYGANEEDKRDSGFDENEPMAHSLTSDEQGEEQTRSSHRDFLPRIDQRDNAGERLTGRSVEEERRRHGLPFLRPNGASSRDLRRQMQQRALKDKMDRRALRRQQAAEFERQRMARAEAEEQQEAAEETIRQRRQTVRDAATVRETARKEAAEKVLKTEMRRKKEEEELAALTARRQEEERRLAEEGETERKRRLFEEDAEARAARQKEIVAAADAAGDYRLPVLPEIGSAEATDNEALERQKRENEDSALEEERRKAEEEAEEEAMRRKAEEAAAKAEEKRKKREAAEAAARKRAEEAEKAEIEEMKRREEEEKRTNAEKEREKMEEMEEKERAEKERAEKERAEKERAEKERAEKERAEKERAEKERAEKEKEKQKKKEKEAAPGDAEANKENAEVREPPKAKAPEEKSKKSRKLQGLRIQKQYSRSDHILDRYELGKVMGDGNFAIVRACRKKESGNEYALKIIDKAKLRGRENMVENEIDIMHACNHSNIVKLRDEYETPTEIFLVMELVKGGDLFDAITQSVKFSEPQSASMVNDLSQALFYLHSRLIVHRDLKPENLLVVRNKNGSLSLKLADFGLAMEVKRLIYTVCGTPTYVAPEILEEKGYGLEVDLWALGVITYILLCGFPPFRSPDRKQTELFELIRSGRFEFLSPYWDSISNSAKDLISHLLVVDRKRRYSAIDVLCHPWVVSIAGTAKLGQPLSEYRQALRKSLESRAKAELQEFRAMRASGHSAVLPVPA